MNMMDLGNFNTIMEDPDDSELKDNYDISSAVISPSQSRQSLHYNSNNGYNPMSPPLNYASDTETGGIDFVEDLLRDKELLNSDAAKHLKEKAVIISSFLFLLKCHLRLNDRLLLLLSFGGITQTVVAREIFTAAGMDETLIMKFYNLLNSYK